MIVFELECRPQTHRFEAWFRSSDDFARQQEAGLLACPQCGSTDVVKAPMAPRVPRKGNQMEAPAHQAPVQGGAVKPEVLRAMQALAKVQAAALESSRWVGDDFAEHSRAMHYGERDAEAIHGEATLQEAKELLQEGIQVLPLPFPVVPPGKAN